MSKETVKSPNKFSVNVLEERNGFYSVTSLGPDRRRGDFKAIELLEKGKDIFTLYEYTSPTGEITREINVTALAPDKGYGLNTCSACFNQNGELIQDGGSGTHYPKGDPGYYEEREKIKHMSLKRKDIPKHIDFEGTWGNVMKLARFGTQDLNTPRVKKLFVTK